MFSSDYWSGILTEPYKLVILFLIFALVTATTIVIITVVSKKKGNYEKLFTTRDVTYASVCLASSFALSFIPLYQMPSGGTVTPASVLPILIFCYYFGFRKSLVVCSAYMLLQLLQKPYIVSPYSALLDYMLPYLSLSVMGLFRYKKANGNLKKHARFFIGAIAYLIIRLFSHTLSGVLFWASGIDFLVWNGDLVGVTAWAYSLTYNALFLIPDTAIAVVASIFLLSSRSFNSLMDGKIKFASSEKAGTSVTSNGDALNDSDTCAKDD